MLNTKNREVLSFWNTITLMGFLQKSTGKKKTNKQTNKKQKQRATERHQKTGDSIWQGLLSALDQYMASQSIAAASPRAHLYVRTWFQKKSQYETNEKN